MRQMLGFMLQALVDAEATAAIGAAPHERTEDRVAHRNGTRSETVSTTAGDLSVRIPKLRTGSFFPTLLEPRRRVDVALRPGGLAISVVGPPDPAFAAQLGKPLLRPVMALMSRGVRRRAAKLGVRYSFLFMRASGEQLATLAALYDDGTLRPVLDRTFDFDDTLEAVAHVEQGRARGKVVITQ
ncbi:unannotated protein [freshwater metagenome]|uniref:Unannotated protein n=1 Tax=freshwater metagenome TaxID=449393 RepID=A0A6J6U0P2_9ZZZZ|nr:zinc-binding dehydrogenase [Actinomycetota bacterium]